MNSGFCACAITFQMQSTLVLAQYLADEGSVFVLQYLQNTLADVTAVVVLFQY